MRKYYKMYTCCRNCQHSVSNHLMYTQVYQAGGSLDLIVPLEFVPCNMLNTTGIGLCNCMNWSSADNLEYLEDRADEQAKLRKS